MKIPILLLWPSLVLAAFITAAPDSAAQTKFFTAPYGAGGTYNLYEVVTTVATWDAANTAALAREAQATGVAGVAGDATTGHLVQISSEDENTFVALAAALAPNSGNSNLWLGLNDVAVEQGSNRTGWEWSGTGGDLLDPGEFSAWAAGEPNNSGEEDAGELRTDGLWNDNKINAATTRKYVIEYEIGAAGPISGAREVPVVYTARYGAGNRWNLYRVVATADNWTNAHARAIAATAESTGLASMAGNMTTGHLISLGDSVEAGFAYSATAFGGFGTINTWLGATDDPTYGGTESNGSPTAGWVWAGDPSTPFSYQSWARRPLLNATEPNNGGGTEHYAELRNDSQWNDISAPAATIRRYIIEWEILADDPIPGASMGVPFLGATPDLGPLAPGVWNVRTIRNSDAPAGTAQFNTGGGLPTVAFVATTPPAGVTINNSAHPVINFGESGTAGRSTNGLFWPDTVYPTDTLNVDDNNIVMIAQTIVPIPAPGQYTLSVHSDDGFHLRVKAPVGESAMVVKTTGLGRVDAGDPSAAMFPLGTGDSNTRIVYEASAAGNYVVEFIHFDGTGGSFSELSFAVGSHEYDWDADFTLLGGPVGGTPIMSTFDALATPAGTGNAWGVRTYAVLSAAATDQVDALAKMAAAAGANSASPAINMFDPENPHNSLFTNDSAYPANTTADNNNYGITARGKIVIPAPGLYTVGIQCDDNFALRIGGGVRWRGRYSGFSNTVIDANDPTTIYWMAGGALATRTAVYFDAAGSYDIDLLYYEGGGGSGVEVYYAAGAQQLDADTTTWQLVGDTTAIAPIFPTSVPGTVMGGSGLFGTHRVSGAGQLTTQAGAVAALSNSGVGTHTTGLVTKLNLMDPDLPGRGGYFASEIAIPGDTAGVNDDDFAVHAHGRMRLDVGGTYTFIVTSTDGWALRIAGQAWNGVSGNAGIDPGNPDTIGYNRIGTARDNEYLGRARINLPAGEYDVDFVFFERTSAASVEVFSIAGDFLTLSEYVAVGTANLGDAALRSTAYRLLGHQANPNGYWYPGLTSAGWTVTQSRPITGTVAPVGWGGTNLTTHDAWLDNPANNPTTVTGQPFANVNDPGFGGPGPIPNDSPIQQNNAGGATSVDDNFMVTRFAGSVVIPVDGVYHFGIHGDDGGYFEFLNTGDARPTPTFIRTTADSSSTIALGNISTSSEGVVGARVDTAEGGGNQRVVGEIYLTAGTWPVRSQWFEGTGGGYREIMCGPSGGDATPYVLLRANGASAAAQADISGLYVIGGTFELTDLNVDRGAGTFSITFNSVPGQRYILEASNNTDPMGWGTVNSQIYGAPSAVATTVVLPLGALAPFEFGGRVFVRMRLP